MKRKEIRKEFKELVYLLQYDDFNLLEEKILRIAKKLKIGVDNI